MLIGAAVAVGFPSPSRATPTGFRVFASIGVFAVAAIGLNVVVGLAGLLDLGYVAFFGVGAYVGALFSNASLTTVNIHLPFLVVVILGGCIAAVFGLVIGTPTLRLRGDYLAIVTLGFGEIFRITANNWDGLTTGPTGSGDPRPGRRRVRLRRVAPAVRHQPARVRQLLLRRAPADRRRHPGLHPPERQPHRPGVGRHPGGRAGRRRQRDRHHSAQAPGIRHRRLPGRLRRHGERPRHHPGLTGLLHVPGIDPAGGRRGPGRDRHGARRPARVDGAVRPAGKAAVVPGQAPAPLRRRPHPGHALPPRRARAQPAPAAGAAGGGARGVPGLAGATGSAPGGPLP